MSPLKICFCLILLAIRLSVCYAEEFSAEFQEGNGIKLSWNRNIDSEGNYFILERSPDGAAYVQIAEISKIEATETGFYRYIDRTHNLGFNYYRLSLISQTGGIMATFLAVEEAYQLTSNLVIYPNPSPGNVKISIFNTLFERADLFIFDTMGRKVFHQPNITPNDSWTIDLDLNGLRPGLYMLYYKSDKRLKKNTFPIILIAP